MAFQIERVSKDERKKEYVLPEWGGTVNPGMYWTVNDDRSVKLFRFHRPIEQSDQPYFALIWKDHPVKVQLKEHILQNDTVEWSLLQLCMPKSIVNLREEVLEDLRVAMKTFGLFGNLFLQDKEPKNIIIKF